MTSTQGRDNASAETSGHTPRASRLLARILDYGRPLDCLWLVLYAALPIGVAYWAGAFTTTADGFTGYGDTHWPYLGLVLALALFTVRRVVLLVAPMAATAGAREAPVVALIPKESGRAQARAALRRSMLAPLNLHAALLITLAIHVADMGSLAVAYASCDAPAAHGEVALTPEIDTASAVTEPGALGHRADGGGGCTAAAGSNRISLEATGATASVEKDWSVAYLDPAAGISKWHNAVLNLVAYSIQFAILFLAMLLVLLILRHNLFFLSRVYQRRRVPAGEEHAYIHIDLDDKENCFGFRRANDAFNVQVRALAVAAAFILITRFANVRGDGSGLFPDVGQVLAVVSWLVALFIVSMPIFVKVLPRLPNALGGGGDTSLVGYLREFLADEAWAVSRDTPSEEVDAVAARFAANSFWPTGNNRARLLYFVSFWVFMIALVPDPRAIAGLQYLPGWSQPAGWVLAGIPAAALTWVGLTLLRVSLSYIDARLVADPDRAAEQGAVNRRRNIAVGVFISYRRDDTGPSTGRLTESLTHRMDPRRIFRDLDSIAGGVNFIDAITDAIASAQAMIVVIGPQWLTLAGADGRPRIQDPADLVHREVALGLQRGLRIFPVLLGGAAMPREQDLPPALQGLASQNARQITESRWSYDTGLLFDELGDMTPPRTGPTRED